MESDKNVICSWEWGTFCPNMRDNHTPYIKLNHAHDNKSNGKKKSSNIHNHDPCTQTKAKENKINYNVFYLKINS